MVSYLQHTKTNDLYAPMAVSASLLLNTCIVGPQTLTSCEGSHNEETQIQVSEPGAELDLTVKSTGHQNDLINSLSQDRFSTSKN